MDVHQAIRGGYSGSGEVLTQSVVHFLRDGSEYAPCDLVQKTLLLARDIENGYWEIAYGQIRYILDAVRGVFLNERGVEWATWIGMAQKVVTRAGATPQ